MSKLSLVALCATLTSPLMVSAGQDLSSPFEENPAVIVFDDSMSKAEIEAVTDKIYKQQRLNHFGQERYALLFKPGHYPDLDIKVGYYTQVLGLGELPDDVTIQGALHTQDKDPPHNCGPNEDLECPPDWGFALDNFWRAAENLAVVPTHGAIRWDEKIIPKDENVWAVSQAAPIRRIHVKQSSESGGNLRLFELGYSSGGFMANTKVDGYVESGSQQQWLSRNSQWHEWVRGNWNMVFVGSETAVPYVPTDKDKVPEGAWASYPFVDISKTPVVAEKPYLVYADGQYKVAVPELASNTKGVNYQKDPLIGLEQFYVANPSDSSETLNQALAAGKNLLITPGVYKLASPLKVTKANTVVLGMGIASLVPTNGTAAIEVADVDGVRVAGLMIDAGEKSSKTLMQVGGDTKSNIDHSQNPTVISDLFCRVGGDPTHVGTAESCMTVNSNSVIGDDFWLWRADHGAGVAWDLNKSDHGIIVNGDDVTIYGLAVEHFQKHQTIWNGENGKVYFYQSELPYDPPSQADWMDGNKRGYASYKVSDNVQNHEAWGAGVYSYFRDSDATYAENAFEVAGGPGINFHNLSTVWLDGKSDSGIKSIINGVGKTISGNAGDAKVAVVADWPQR